MTLLKKSCLHTFVTMVENSAVDKPRVYTVSLHQDGLFPATYRITGLLNGIFQHACIDHSGVGLHPFLFEMK